MTTGRPTMPPWANDNDVAHLQTKMLPKSLIWSESAWWLLSSGIHKILGALIMTMGMSIITIWANYHDAAHLRAKTVPKNLIWSESNQWLLSFSIRKIPRAFIMPMGIPIMPPWANYHDAAHLQAKTVPMNLIWSETTQWLLSSGVHKIPGALIMPMGMLVMPVQENDKTMHIYMPRRFQITWFGGNQNSGCWGLASARCQGPLLCPWPCPLCPTWANDHDVAHLQAKRAQKNLVWSESTHWLLSSGIRKFQGPLSCPWACPLCSHRPMAIMLHIYRTRQFQCTWYGVNQPSGCWVQASARFQGLLSCPWACPLCLHGQMTMTCHIYKPRQFQWTWFGMNQPDGYSVSASAKFGPDKWMGGQMNERTESIP